jgi:hypothetical protein
MIRGQRRAKQRRQALERSDITLAGLGTNSVASIAAATRSACANRTTTTLSRTTPSLTPSRPYPPGHAPATPERHQQLRTVARMSALLTSCLPSPRVGVCRQAPIEVRAG